MVRDGSVGIVRRARRAPRPAGWRVAVGVGALLAATGAAPADEPAPPAWKPSAPVRVTAGYDPWLSPSGKRLAFQRGEIDSTARDEDGQPTLHGLLRVLDLATGAESKTARDGRMSGWAGDDLFVLEDGSSVRVAGSGDAPKLAATPDGRWASASGRSRDGRLFAFVHGADLVKSLRSGEGRIPGVRIQVAEAGKPVQAFDVGDGPDMSGARGLLSFSPDGKRLAVHLRFMHYGQPPHPRVAVVDLESSVATFVFDEPYGSRGGDDAGAWQSGVTGQWAWDGQGERFAFVRTTGDTRRDLYVASADGMDLRRVTTDGEWKASPCLSPEGDRCAYWIAGSSPSPPSAGRSERPSAEPERTALRVLFLRTGDHLDLPAPGEGRGSDLQWAPDGHSLWYAWSGRETDGIWRVAAPPPPEVAPGTAIVDRAASPVDELLESLRSEDHDEVEAAIERSRDMADPRVTKALLDVLHRWAREKFVPRPYDVVFALHARRALAAIPDLLLVLGTGEWTDSVSPPLLDWRVTAAVPIWRRIATAGPPSSRGTAAAALAVMGEPDGWDSVRRAAASSDASTRASLCRSLVATRDPRAVDVLIPLLSDGGQESSDYRGPRSVARFAALALKRLTGQSLGRDAAAWTAWWEKAGKRLPDPAPAYAPDEDD